MANLQVVAPQVVAPGVTLYLQTPLYNGQYRPGQTVTFPSAQAAYNFLNAAPECVQTDIQYPYPYGAGVTVYASNQCWPQPGPRPGPPPCPCARGY
jgi:hypothetical protein